MATAVQQQQPQQRIPPALQAIFLASNRGEVVDKPPEGGEAFKVFVRPESTFKNPFRGVFRRNTNKAPRGAHQPVPVPAAYHNNSNAGPPAAQPRWANPNAAPLPAYATTAAKSDLTARSRLFFTRRTRHREDEVVQYNSVQQQHFHPQQQLQQQQPVYDKNDPESSYHQRSVRSAFDSSQHDDASPYPSFPYSEKDLIKPSSPNGKGSFRSLRSRLNVFKRRKSVSKIRVVMERNDSIPGKDFYCGNNTVGGGSSHGANTGVTCDPSTINHQFQNLAVEEISSTSSVGIDDTDFTTQSGMPTPATGFPATSQPPNPVRLDSNKRIPKTSRPNKVNHPAPSTTIPPAIEADTSMYSREDGGGKRKKPKNASSAPKSVASAKPKSSLSSTKASERSLQGFFDRLISARGYSTDTYATLETGYHNDSTPLQEASYTSYTVNVAKHGDATNLRRLLKCGLSPNPANYYGESLMHIICRSGSHELLQIMLECGATVQVSDDVGRTPMHNACWANVPSFATIELLLQRDTFLMHLRDARGSTPLEYVRKEHWPAWISFFLSKKNKYWPVRVPEIHGRQLPPALIRIPPNALPVLDPPNALNIALARMVAKGTMEPEDAMLLQTGDLGDDEDDDDDDDEDDDDDDEEDSDDSYDESTIYGGRENVGDKEEEVSTVGKKKKQNRLASADTKNDNNSLYDEMRFFTSKDSIYGDNNSTHTSTLRNMILFDENDEDDMLLDEMLRRVACSKQRQKQTKKPGDKK